MSRATRRRGLAAVALLAVAALLLSACGRYGRPRRGPDPDKVPVEQPAPAPAETPR